MLLNTRQYVYLVSNSILNAIKGSLPDGLKVSDDVHTASSVVQGEQVLSTSQGELNYHVNMVWR